MQALSSDGQGHPGKSVRATHNGTWPGCVCPEWADFAIFPFDEDELDSMSAEFIKGAVIDFSDAMTGGGFKISNPRARSSCGCGKSFEA